MAAHLILGITNFITATIDQSGYLGVAFLMAIESAAIPLPSEIIMPFAGFLALSGRFSLLRLALAGAGGSLVGSLLTYALGFYGGRLLIEKYGKFALISGRDLAVTEKFFVKFGSWASFLGRLVPVVRTFISIPAGIGEEPVISFSIFSFLGSLIWSYFLATLGFKLGQNWPSLGNYFHKFDAIVVLLFVAGLAWWVWRHVKHRSQ